MKSFEDERQKAASGEEMIRGRGGGEEEDDRGLQ